MSRHLEPALVETRPARELAFAGAGAPAAVGARTPVLDAQQPPPAEFNWRDYLAMLLHVAAEIEHSLMVEYLFAAYSLGGPQVPSELRGRVRDWQETILGIAKEEMGHLVTVQNLLTALGMPLNLDREDYPWGSQFYPFDFTLRRLTLDSLATYVVAESPADWTGKEADEIRARAGGAVNRVGALYSTITDILRDPKCIADTDFDAATLPHQASWDEWGRGYREGARQETTVPGVRAPDLLILEVYSRDTAVSAIAQIGDQGESSTPLPDGPDAGEDSHFTRFLSIYCALSKVPEPDRSKVSRFIRDNPTTQNIVEPEALAWAHLFNLRYRMLLVNLAHAFELAAGDDSSGGPRGALVNRTFAEMYNLRAIAGTLVGLKAEGGGPEGPHYAGPPFEMPYTLDLPRRERDRWRLHRDLIEAAAALIGPLKHVTSREGRRYLTALAEADALVLAQIRRLL
jgi:Ferritin-like